MPIDSKQAGEFYGGTGQFFSIKRDLKPGQSIIVQLEDINENRDTRYPIKGKEYGYRVNFTDAEGNKRMLDLNGRDSIGQIMKALYPGGAEKGLVPCKAKISRRTERTTKQSEVIIERVEEDSDVPF